jgi:hypothetical protein
MKVPQTPIVELVTYAEMTTTKSRAYHVFVNGKRAGYVEKFADTRGDRYPWAAFAASKTEAGRSVRVANFRTWEGGKKAAVAAVVEAALSHKEPVRC